MFFRVVGRDDDGDEGFLRILHRATLEDASKLFLLLAVASFIVRKGIVKPYTLQPFELLVICSTLFTLAHVVRHGWREARKRPTREFVVVFALLLFCIGVGTVNGHRLFGTDDEILRALVKDYFYLGTAMLAWLLIVYWGDDATWRRRILLAFLVPLILTPSIAFPGLQSWVLRPTSPHLVGLHDNPSEFGSYLVVTFAVLLSEFTRARARRSRALLWTCLVVTLTLILWTGSRGAWCATLAVAGFVGSASFRRERARWSGVRSVGAMLGIGLVTFSLAFVMTPNRPVVIARIFPQIKAGVTSSQTPEDSGKEIVETLWENPRPSVPEQNRRSIWAQSIELLGDNLIGLGPEYARGTRAIQKPEGGFTGAHNSFLEVGLAGGVGGLAILLYLGWRLVTALWRIRPRDREWLASGSAALGLVLVSAFNGILQGFPWLWVIAGLIFARSSCSRGPGHATRR